MFINYVHPVNVSAAKSVVKKFAGLRFYLVLETLLACVMVSQST